MHVAASRFTKRRCEMDLQKGAAPSVSHAERCKQATQSLLGFGSGDAGGRPSTVTAVTSPDSGLPSNVKEESKCRRRCLLKRKQENLNIWSSSPGRCNELGAHEYTYFRNRNDFKWDVSGLAGSESRRQCLQHFISAVTFQTKNTTCETQCDPVFNNMLRMYFQWEDRNKRRS